MVCNFFPYRADNELKRPTPKAPEHFTDYPLVNLGVNVWLQMTHLPACFLWVLASIYLRLVFVSKFVVNTVVEV